MKNIEIEEQIQFEYHSILLNFNNL